jgi:serine protease
MKGTANTLLFILYFFLVPAAARAQSAGTPPREFLVVLQPGTPAEALTAAFEAAGRGTLTVRRKVADFVGAWLLEAPADEPVAVLDWLRRQPGVRVAQFNWPLDDRTMPPGPPPLALPDDPLFSLQWQYVNTGAAGGLADADLDAEAAWDVTTGGLTAAGDTIVVAVIDGGVQATHADLAANLWVNRAEVPGDEIDNDNNGYIDDYRGWNVFTQTDHIEGLATGHGTPVSGIVAARGNNALGVTGVNWNVKLLFVAGSGTMADVLAAYDYVLQVRRRYDASGGTEGAFVVALNCSWGFNYGQPADAPLWCAAIDTLGAAGIVNVAATANLPVDVDLVGDLPTTCPSPYLLSVTSLTNADVTAGGAAWGATHIDLGAYGHGVYTLTGSSGYGVSSGTSFAAPHVAGAIGLLYAAPCPNLIAMAQVDPGAGALWAKTLVLDNSQPNASLAGLTLSGARLNLGTLLAGYTAACSPCPAPFSLEATALTGETAALGWAELPEYEAVELRWRPVGAAGWTLAEPAAVPWTLDGLAPCTEYEFSLRASCADATLSDWSPVVSFRTDGCCTAPVVTVPPAFLTTGSALIEWTALTAAGSYDVEWQQVGTGFTNSVALTDNGMTLAGLDPCTEYAVRVRAHCPVADTTTAYSDPVYFTTEGCGSCVEAMYCSAAGGPNTEEWIESIALGGWTHSSGAGGGGYENFTGLPDAPVLVPGSIVPVTLTPVFLSSPFKEYFRLYIDYNGDGDFGEPDELAFDPQFASEEAVNGMLYVPLQVPSGVVRMRVLMKYSGPGNPPPTPCENYMYGQVEDYCVAFEEVVSAAADYPDRQAWRLEPQPAHSVVRLERAGPPPQRLVVSVWNAAGQPVYRQELSAGPPFAWPVGDWKAGLYFVIVQDGNRVERLKLVKL